MAAEARVVVSESFREYRDITVIEPLRQGDVLEAIDPAASMWQRHLLVITADCDFAHAKHQGRVTCVPLLIAEEYLLEMQVPRVRQRILAKALAALRQVLTPIGAGSISEERLLEWPREVDPHEIVASLGLNGRASETATAALEAIRIVGQPAATLAEAVEILLTAHLTAPDPPKRENAAQQIVSILRAPYSNPPGDAFFLSAIAHKHELGYFAYLRHLEQVWETQIATGPTKSAVNYRRISRLQDRFIHALVQRFALVFMAIGLPRDYEEMRDLHAELVGEAYA